MKFETNSKTKTRKLSNYSAVLPWMLNTPIESALEMYLYAGIYGMTQVSGAWRGTPS